MINIQGLDKAKVLCALYNASRPLGLGFLHYVDADMQIEEARERLRAGDYFDYLHGRLMKVRIHGDSLDPRLYDRDLGEGAAARAIDAIR